jgi:O-antigen ligase
MLLALLLSPWWVPGPVKERIVHTFTQEELPDQLTVGKIRIDTSTSARIRSWQSSLERWKANPIFGTGVTGGPFMDAMYPRVLTETGTIGLVAFLTLLWSLFYVGLQAYREASDPYSRGLTLGFLLGHIGVLAHAVGANTFLIVRIMEPFWLIAALVVRQLMVVRLEARAAKEKASLTLVADEGDVRSANRLPLRSAYLPRSRKL